MFDEQGEELQSLGLLFRRTGPCGCPRLGGVDVGVRHPLSGMTTSDDQDRFQKPGYIYII